MIKYIKDGNIFDSECEALVNPVNTVGVMGAGLAKIFKQKFPKNFESYKTICDQENLFPGNIWCYFGENNKTIVNAATKAHWKDPSRLIWIELALVEIKYYNFNSVALPKLGCGLGGLDWEKEVKPLYELHLPSWHSQLIEVYI